MRTLGDICRRGMENVLANWPLILIRIAEGIAILVMMVVLVVVAALPVGLAGAGFSAADLEQYGDVEELLTGIGPLVILYALVVFTVVFTLAVIIHSFVMAGVVGCYLEGDRRAPEGNFGRMDFKVFTPELWAREARRHAWRFFWIYNVIWGVYSVILLVPLLFLAVLAFLMREAPAGIAIAVIGMILVMLVAILLAIVAFIYSQVALIESARTGAGVFESLRRARGVTRQRMANVLLTSVIYFSVSMLIGGILAGFGFALGMMGSIPGLDMAFLPFRVLFSLFNSAVSTIFGCWLLAALIAATAPVREVRPHVPAGQR